MSLFPYPPDIRIEYDYIPTKWTTPKIVHKDYIKDPEKYDKKKDFLINYFFAKPDYEAPHEKLFYSSFLGAKFGAANGALHVLTKEIAVWDKALLTFGKSFGLFTCTFATYGAATTAIANIRGKKDDLLNHAIGGASLGFIYGYLYKSSAAGAIAAFVCSCIGAATKRFHRDGEYIFHPKQDVLSEHNTLFSDTKFQDLRLYHGREEKKRNQHYNYL